MTVSKIGYVSVSMSGLQEVLDNYCDYDDIIKNHTDNDESEIWFDLDMDDKQKNNLFDCLIEHNIISLKDKNEAIENDIDYLVCY